MNKEILEKIKESLKKKNIMTAGNIPKEYANGFQIEGLEKELEG